MKRIISLFLTFVMVGSLAACGDTATQASESSVTNTSETTATSESTKPTEEVKKDPVTVTLFHSNGNLTSGPVGGWLGEYFAEQGIILDIWPYSADKFNAILASGEYPDVMFFNYTTCDLSSITESGYLLDLYDYMDYLPVIRDSESMQNAIAYAQEYVLTGTEKLGAIPCRVGMNGTPVNTGGDAIMLNWELYEKIGSPKITCLEDTIDVFKKMQAEWPQAENGLKTYAMHLYSDVDVASGAFVGINNVLRISGYTSTELHHFLVGNTANNEFEYILEDDGIYKYGLKYINTLYKEGLLDPDSLTYDRQTVINIVDTEASALAGWSNVPAYETKGYMPVYYDGMRVIDTGSFSAYGGTSYVGVSAKSKNIEAALKVVNLLADPDSMFIVKNGPEGELWEYGADGIPVLTEKGIARYVNGEEVDIKGETFTNFNVMAIQMFGTLTSFDKPYWAAFWPEVSGAGSNTDTMKRWKEFYGLSGEEDFVDLLGDDCVQVAFDDNLNRFAEVPSDEEELLWAAAQDVIVQASWKMVYAESDAEFEKLWDDAVAECEELGVEELVEARLKALDAAAEIEASLTK